MVITRPNHDVTTNYLFYWSKELISLAQEKHEIVADLAEKRANKKEFTAVIKKTKPRLIVVNGHGNANVFTGYDNEPLIQGGENHELLKGAVVYARSCSSARELGVKAVDSGCKAYIGYDDDFVFLIDDDKITKPLEDNAAGYFMEPSNQVVRSLLKGHEPQEAHRRAKEVFKKTIQKLMASNASKEDLELVPHLAWDYQHQVCIN